MLPASIDRTNILSGLYPDRVIVHPQLHDEKRVIKYTGKMMCPMDEDLLGFLLRYNQVSLPGIGFAGIGDTENVRYLYRFTGDCWEIALCERLVFRRQ